MNWRRKKKGQFRLLNNFSKIHNQVIALLTRVSIRTCTWFELFDASIQKNIFLLSFLPISIF